jgi:vacuolar-type H+-ATPase subunit F/Vma7
MGHIAAIGERTRVAGLATAGVTVLVAEHPDAVRDAWRELPTGVSLVILTPAAADVIGPALEESALPLAAVMPP